MKDNPKISVCIPYHNCGAFIDECLTSIVKQTYTNWEVIIFNDGSAADEAKRLRNGVSTALDHIDGINTMQQNHADSMSAMQQIRIIDSENIGIFAARIALYYECKGDIIVSVDSDDYLCNERAFERIVSAFSEQKGDAVDAVLYNAVRSVGGSFNLNYTKLLGANDDFAFVDGDRLREEFCCDDQLNNVWAKAVTLKVIDELLASGIDETLQINMADDVYINTFLYEHIHRAAIINEAFYFYRVNSASTVLKNVDNTRLDGQIFVEKQLAEAAKRWKVVRFNSAAHACEFLIYGYLMYIQLGDVSAPEKVEAYKKLASNEFIKTSLCKAVTDEDDFKQIPRHKRIPLRIFADGHYKRLLAYFSGLEKLKSLKK